MVGAHESCILDTMVSTGQPLSLVSFESTFLTLPAVRGYLLRVHGTYADATTRTRLCPVCAYVTMLAKN